MNRPAVRSKGFAVVALSLLAWIGAPNSAKQPLLVDCTT